MEKCLAYSQCTISARYDFIIPVILEQFILFQFSLLVASMVMSDSMYLSFFLFTVFKVWERRPNKFPWHPHALRMKGSDGDNFSSMTQKTSSLSVPLPVTPLITFPPFSQLKFSVALRFHSISSLYVFIHVTSSAWNASFPSKPQPAQQIPNLVKDSNQRLSPV